MTERADRVRRSQTTRSLPFDFYRPLIVPGDSFAKLVDFFAQPADFGSQFVNRGVHFRRVFVAVFVPLAGPVPFPLHLFGMPMNFAGQFVHAGLLEMLGGGAEMFDSVHHFFQLPVAARVLMPVAPAIQVGEPLACFFDPALDFFEFVTFSGPIQFAGVGVKVFQMMFELVNLPLAILLPEA